MLLFLLSPCMLPAPFFFLHRSARLKGSGLLWLLQINFSLLQANAPDAHHAPDLAGVEVGSGPFLSCYVVLMRS